MKDSAIRTAADEARRFLRRCDELEAEKVRQRQTTGEFVPKEQAALRRASMDLTRALADMRRRG